MRTIKSQTSISEVVVEPAFRVMDEPHPPLLAVQKSGKRGFDKGSIIVSCDSLRRLRWPPVLDTVEVWGSSPHVPTLSFNKLLTPSSRCVAPKRSIQDISC